MEVTLSNRLVDSFQCAAQGSGRDSPQDEPPLEDLVGMMREHNVPYLVRACIDLDLREGCLYTLTPLPLLKLFPDKCRLSIVRKRFFVFLVNL